MQMEQKILADIQQAMAEDIASDEELTGLVDEVQELQTKIVRRVSVHAKRFESLIIFKKLKEGASL